MQATRVQHRVVFGGTRAIVLAAVAVAGVGIGYWVLPQDGSEQVAPVAITRPVMSAAERIVVAKIAQMDRADAAFSPVTREDVQADAIVAAKTAQMDRADAAFSPASDDVARADTIVAAKIAQMDRADAAFGQGGVAGVSTSPDSEAQAAAEQARAARIWAVKFGQMEEQDDQ